MKLDLEGILEYQQNRSPYLMIDYATEIVPGESAKGYKNLDNDLWFFKCHFPDDPNMPGMLQVEAMVQLCALSIFTLPNNKGKVAYLSSVKNMKLLKKVLPNDRLELDTKINTFKRGIVKASGIGKVDGTLVCKAEFVFVIPHILDRYKIS